MTVLLQSFTPFCQCKSPPGRSLHCREFFCFCLGEAISQAGFPSFLALPIFTLCCVFPASTHTHTHTHTGTRTLPPLSPPGQGKESCPLGSVKHHCIGDKAARTPPALNPLSGFSSGGRGGAALLPGGEGGLWYGPSQLPWSHDAYVRQVEEWRVHVRHFVRTSMECEGVIITRGELCFSLLCRGERTRRHAPALVSDQYARGVGLALSNLLRPCSNSAWHRKNDSVCAS